MRMKAEGVRKRWDKYKYAAAVVLIGAVLLLWPSGSSDTPAASNVPQTQQSLETQDLKTEMEEILTSMNGVGQVKVLLTLDSDGERQLAQDTELSYSGSTASPEDYLRRSETILVDSTSGDETVVTRRTYPTYRGALVVCQGGGQAEVKLAVTQAVAALTGLPADRIVVEKWQ